MSATLNFQELKKEESDHGIIQEDDNFNKTTYEKQKNYKCNSNINDLLEKQLDKQKKEAKRVQNKTKLPQLEAKIQEHVAKKVAKSTFSTVFDEDVYAIITPDQTLPNSSLQITSIDGFFNRKRGRPPKNRFVEVYKNTHRWPQAIFTSFKLQKQDVTKAAPIYDNSLGNCTQIATPNLTTNGIDNTVKQKSRHTPMNENSTQRKSLRMVNTIVSSTISSADSNSLCTMVDDGENTNYNASCTNSYKLNLKNLSIKSLEDSKNLMEKSVFECHETVERGHSTLLALDSRSDLKNLRLFGTSDNVTVIRAAGTFYPENCKGNSRNYAKEQSCVKVKVKSASDLPQNLSLKGENQVKAIDDLEYSRSVAHITASCSSTLQQIYNILQMQQQLCAFYQQMAIMTPAFTHLTSTLGHSSTMIAPSDLFLNTHIINMISNFQKQNVNQNISHNKLDSRLRQMHKKSGTTIKSIKDSDRPQNTFYSSYSDKKLPETQRQYVKEKTPSGYLRFRCNEDCGYQKCSYRQHQSHFHCSRVECHYSFCDKTRLVQHTARHERLDTLMGNDFRQYRSTIHCNSSHCPYAFSDVLNYRKSSHFHCLKCPFVCADTNKLVAHRRLHNKMEFIRSAGFRKVNIKENCMMPNIILSGSRNETQFENIVEQNPSVDIGFEIISSNCPYALRHAHYHCLVCNCSVLSRSQVLSHKHQESAVPTTSQ